MCVFLTSFGFCRGQEIRLFLFEQNGKYWNVVDFVTSSSSSMILMYIYVQDFYSIEAMPCYLIESFSEVLVFAYQSQKANRNVDVMYVIYGLC